MIYATSISAVGPTSGPVGDDTRLAPGNVYGATKAFCEHLAAAMSARPGAPAYLGLRFGYVYGPGRVRGWRDVQSIIERVAAGERSSISRTIRMRSTGRGSTTRRSSVARHRATAPRNAVVNVVGDKRTIRDAIAHLCGGVPIWSRAAAQRPRPLRRGDWSDDRLETLLGTVPTTTLEQGIDRMLGP